MSVDQNAVELIALAKALAAPRRDGWRDVDADTAAGKLRAILSEVETAILPRALEVQTGDDHCVIVANGARVVALGPGEETAVHPDSREERLCRAAQRLRRFCQAKGGLRVLSRPATDAVLADDIGLTHKELTRYAQDEGWLREEGDTGFHEALLAEASATALFPADGAVGAVTGDAAALPDTGRMKALAEELAGWLGGANAALEGDAWIIARTGPEADHTLGMLIGREGVAFQALDTDALFELTAKWASAHRKDGTP